MTAQSILFTRNNHIAWITLNRPQDSNRFDLAMAQELSGICFDIKGDQAVSAVFLTAVGSVFCTGGKLTPEDISIDTLSPAEAIAALDKPVIAVINGDAFGLGLELALACDMRIAANTASFSLPQIAEGRLPMNGGTQRLSRIVGKAKALEMILTGQIINAQDAFEIGLVNKAVKATDLPAEAEKLAAILAGKAPFALRYAKEAVIQGLDLTLDQALRLEADLYFLLHTTADRTEGIQSFLQKRPPKYAGK